MPFFNELIANKIFVTAAASWFIAQLMKVILTLIKQRKFDVYRMFGSGGFPSSHTSFVMGLSTAVGLDRGFESAEYAIALVLTLVVMYDAAGVRRAVGKQAIILNTIIDDMYSQRPIGDDRLKELVGHTPFEVLAGAILGIITANVMI